MAARMTAERAMEGWEAAVPEAAGPGGAAAGTVLCLRGGTICDADGERRGDVLVRDGVVSEVADGLAAPPGALVLDCEGAWVVPGLVDLHAHLREPGGEEAETIETGARAGVLGGFTALVAMPNTEPPLDDPAVVAAVAAAGRRAACRVVPAGCVTRGRGGAELAPLGELYDLGVRVFTDDGACVADAGVLRAALEYTRALPGAVVAQHAEDPGLAADGHMHEGAWSSRLGIPGRPAAAETAVLARDLEVVRHTGGRYHLLHCSAAGSLPLLRAARDAGLAVTAEVTPHHCVLTDERCATFDPVYKVNPPLREAPDRDAMVTALAGGVIDAIATDHAPHPPVTKERPFEEAPPGMLGLQTALAVIWTHLVATGRLAAAQAFAALSWRPAAIAGLDAEGHGGPVAPGRPAHLTVFDPTVRWCPDAAVLTGPSTNSPFLGVELTGRVRHTVVGGEAVVVDHEAQR
jgi:dihydroorotase